MPESRVDWTVPNAIEPTTTGYLVTENGVCPRCGDQNSDDVVCLTCTNPSDPNSKAYWSGVLELLRERTKRIAELERQRDAVLALVDGLLAGVQGTEPPEPQIRRYLNHIRAAINAQASKPVLLDVSRDPGQHPRDETGRYVQGSGE